MWGFWDSYMFFRQTFSFMPKLVKKQDGMNFCWKNNANKTDNKADKIYPFLRVTQNNIYMELLLIHHMVFPR